MENIGNMKIKIITAELRAKFLMDKERLVKSINMARKRIENAQKAFNNAKENIKKQEERAEKAEQQIKFVKIKIANQIAMLQRYNDLLGEK